MRILLPLLLAAVIELPLHAAVQVQPNIVTAYKTPFGSSPSGSFGSTTGYVPSQSYSDYYSRSLNKYHRPPTSTRDYIINKYYYHRPTLSPYLNLSNRRSPTHGLNNYHRYVLPELERRAQAQGEFRPVGKVSR